MGTGREKRNIWLKGVKKFVNGYRARKEEHLAQRVKKFVD